MVFDANGPVLERERVRMQGVVRGSMPLDARFIGSPAGKDRSRGGVWHQLSVFVGKNVLIFFDLKFMKNT